MAGHENNEQADLRAHQKTFNGFIKLLTWTCIISAVILIFLALSNS